MKAVIAVSGGLDSAVLLARAVKDYGADGITAVGFQYGGRHNIQEQQARTALLGYYGIKSYKFFDLSRVFQESRSALLVGEKPLPAGHYEEESMRDTVVPGRNLIFISVMASLAEQIGADRVLLGVHAGDHYIYPDCRPRFVSAAILAVYASTSSRVEIETPFLDMDKKEIVKLGVELGVPFYCTRTCYSEWATACGVCGSCIERREAFMLNGLEDPIEYKVRGPLPPKPEKTKV